MSKRRLGRGLDALLSGPDDTAAPPESGIAEIALDQIVRGRYQPRRIFTEESLNELAASIRAQGLMQPIVVRPRPQGGYELIAGERRWRAARIAGLDQIPAIVREVADDRASAMALIENIQRENLNPLEEARALDRLIREFEITHQQAADAVGRSRATVSNLLRLLELAPEVAELVDRRELEMGHARALLGLSPPRRQTEVAQLVVKKGLSVRETEALVRRLINPPDKGGSSSAGSDSSSSADANIRELEGRLSDTLGAKVAIEHSGKSGKGRLVVTYNSLDELDGILSHIH